MSDPVAGGIGCLVTPRPFPLPRRGCAQKNIALVCVISIWVGIRSLCRPIPEGTVDVAQRVCDLWSSCQGSSADAYRARSLERVPLLAQSLPLEMTGSRQRGTNDTAGSYGGRETRGTTVPHRTERSAHRSKGLANSEDICLLSALERFLNLSRRVKVALV